MNTFILGSMVTVGGFVMVYLRLCLHFKDWTLPLNPVGVYRKTSSKEGRMLLISVYMLMMLLVVITGFSYIFE